MSLSLIKVNNVEIPSPTMVEWRLSDISDSAAGRTEDTIMHKNRIGQKWSADLTWTNPTAEETAMILTMFDPEYFDVTFTNPKTNSINTRVFYRGDSSIPVKLWRSGEKVYSSISFSIIER